MARKLSHKKAFRAKPGFSRQDVKTRVMQVLKHQKQEPIGIHALEVKVQLKHDERREFYDLLEQMQKSGELWRRRNSVVLSKNQGLIQAQIVTLNEKFGFARPFVEGEVPADKAQDIFLPGRFMLGAMPGDTVMLRVGALALKK